MSRRLMLLSLVFVAVFAIAMHWPLFREGKTVSAFDLAYRFGAYEGERPEEFRRPSNSLLSDAVVSYQAWDVAMFDGPLYFPWLWNPYGGLGSPLLANIQAAPLFPLKHLIYPFSGVRLGFGVLCFLKMLLGGLFTWLYLRSLHMEPLARAVGAVAFMGCGFMVAWHQYTLTNVAIFLPILLLGTELLLRGEPRKGFWIVTGGVALGILGGHPETLFHICVSAGIYLAARVALQSRETSTGVRLHLLPAGPLLVVGGVAGALVAAVQLVPFGEYLLNSDMLLQRSAAKHSVLSWAMFFPARNLEVMRNEFLTYIMPNTFGNPSIHNHWWNPISNFNESAGYTGLGTLMLALFAWRYLARSPLVRALMVLQVMALGFSLRMALVNNTIGALPLFSVAANTRFLLVWCFTNAVLAALAVQEWRQEGRWTVADIGWLGLVVGFLSTLALRRYFGTFAGHAESWIRDYGRQGLAHFSIFLGLTLVALFLLRAKRWGLPAMAAFTLPLLVAADLFLAHHGYNPFMKPESLYPPTAATSFLRTRETPRVLPILNHLGPNIGAVYGIQDPRIYDSLTYRPLARYLSSMGAFTGWSMVRTAPSALTATAGIRYFWSNALWEPASGDVRTVFTHGKERILEDPRARPAAYLASTWRTADSPEAALAMSEGDETGLLTVVEGAMAGGVGSGSEIRAARILRPSPIQVRIELPDQAGGMLVLSDCFYPGWTATVDGTPAQILRANGTFRGVPVPVGSRTVQFIYKPLSYVIGVAVSGLAITLLLALAIVWRRTNRVRGAGASSPSSP